MAAIATSAVTEVMKVDISTSRPASSVKADAMAAIGAASTMQTTSLSTGEKGSTNHVSSPAASVTTYRIPR